MNTFKDYLKEVVPLEYDIVNINGFNILKKDSKYCGIVSEDNIIKSDTSYNTLSELVDSLYSESKHGN